MIKQRLKSGSLCLKTQKVIYYFKFGARYGFSAKRQITMPQKMKKFKIQSN